MSSESNIQDATNVKVPLPRVMVIDDLFGRVHRETRNEERASMCGQFLLEDVTGDEPYGNGTQKIKRPVAQVLFCRGQTPAATGLGDTVENDLDGTLAFVQEHWQPVDNTTPLSMVLLDLCFYTGAVTARSEAKRGKGMPEGRDGDDQPDRYFGFRILEALHLKFPDLPVVILSSMPRDEVFRRFTRLGAFGFLPRGDANSPALLQEYLNRHGLIPDPSGMILGRSKSLLLALRAARRAAASRKNVLILGKSGTGKELIARYLHAHASNFSGKELTTIDSGALSPALYASELFGHVKGAFTGATKDRKGRILLANGGDLFLDEIGNMPEDVQEGLLRAIEQKVVTAVGSDKEQKVDVRFLSATNVNIEEKACTGEGFREDLYYRLREGGVIYLAPLRERKEDIPLLAKKFVRDAEAITTGAMRRSIDAEAMDMLMDYDWARNNIRELRSAIFKAISDYQDVESLVAVHLDLKSGGIAGIRDVGQGGQGPQVSIPADKPEAPDFKSSNLSELLSKLSALEFSAAPEHRLEWAGKLPELQTAFARASAAILKAAIIATLKPTTENPEGKIAIHPAVKLAMGDDTLTASKAADIIKRVLSLDPAVQKQLISDKILRAAYEIAVRLRPKKPKITRKG